MNEEEDSIENEEDIFNINTLLTTLFYSVKRISDDENIELIYNMNSTLPRDLRGDQKTLLKMLMKMFIFIFQNSNEDQIVLSLVAPEDFLYEECVSFKIEHTNIDKEKILTFIETNLSNELVKLDGKIIDDLENVSDIHLSIPFKVIELGFRRHYRLSHKTMISKKILLICTNDKSAQSTKKMFEYFLYDVDISLDILNKNANDLTKYDILIIGEQIMTKEFEESINRAQESSSLKYVLLQEPISLDDNDIRTDLEHFIKPVTQEKVFDLIMSLFNDNEKIDI